VIESSNPIPAPRSWPIQGITSFSVGAEALDLKLASMLSHDFTRNLVMLQFHIFPDPQNLKISFALWRN